MQAANTVLCSSWRKYVGVGLQTSLIKASTTELRQEEFGFSMQRIHECPSRDIHGSTASKKPGRKARTAIRRDVSQQGKKIMVDMLMDIDESAARRMTMAKHVEGAIERTRRLLESPAAEDPNLREIWQRRLAKQQENLVGICR